MLAAATLALLTAGSNDILCLTDGRVFDGLELRAVDAGIEVTFENGTVLVPEDLVLDALISGATVFVPKTPEEKRKFAEGLVPFDGKWVSPKRRERLVEGQVGVDRLSSGVHPQAPDQTGLVGKRLKSLDLFGQREVVDLDERKGRKVNDLRPETGVVSTHQLRRVGSRTGLAFL